MKYSGDFETATWKKDETWVWAWCTVEIGNIQNITYGNSIETFFEWIQNQKNPEIYFHNLKFDSSFILDYLLNNGYEYIENRKDRKSKSFTTLISDLGQFYSIEVFFQVGNKTVKKVTFYDSLKIIPMPVRDIPEAFKLEESKLEIDYNKERPKGHILTQEEKDYITNDVVIVARALELLFSQKLTKMTIGSNALAYFKLLVGFFRFKHYFPQLDPQVDQDLRKAYKRWFYLFKPFISRKRSWKRSCFRRK